MKPDWQQLHFPQPFDPRDALGFLQRLAADESRGPLVFEARAENGTIRHLLGASGSTRSITVSTLRRLVPGAVVSDVDRPRVPMERAGRVRIRQRNLGLALDTSGAALRALFAALSQATGKDDVLVLQVILGPSVPPQTVPPGAADPNLSIFDLVTSGTRPAAHEVHADMRAKLGQHRFRAVVRLGVSAASPVRRRLLVHSMLAALRQLQTGATRIDLVSDRPELVDDAVIPPRKPLRLTADEALCLVGWPTGEKALPGMPPVHPRRLPPPAGFAPTSERVFAATNAPGPVQPVGIAIADALRHTHVVGPTGVGKSTVLLSLIAADIAAGRSVVVIDPKRDLAMDVLSVIPEHRSGDVVVIDPTGPNPVGLNPFAAAQEHGPLVADRLLAVFRGLFPAAFGPRTSDAIHASLLTLTTRDDATLADLPRLLTDARFRRSYTTGISDPALAQFWSAFESQTPAAQAATIGPILSRLRQFLLRPTIRAVLDQSAPRFDLGDLFRQPKIVVVMLHRGTLGPVAAELLGSLIVSQLWQLILGRADVPVKQRTPVSIYLDEAQMFVRHETDLGEALEQSRSLGAAWHLAHQHRGQFPSGLLAAVSANTRNKIQFQADPLDAAAVTKYTELAPDDLTKLPPFHVYVDLLSAGVQTGWFSAVTLPPPAAISDPAHVIAESRARYGRLDDPPEPVAPTRRPSPDGGAPQSPALPAHAETRSDDIVLTVLTPAQPTPITPRQDDADESEPIGRRRKAPR